MIIQTEIVLLVVAGVFGFTFYLGVGVAIHDLRYGTIQQQRLPTTTAESDAKIFQGIFSVTWPLLISGIAGYHLVASSRIWAPLVLSAVWYVVTLGFFIRESPPAA